MITLLIFILSSLFNLYIVSMDSQNAITSKSLLSITDSDLENVTQRSTYKSVKGFPFLDLQTMCEKQLYRYITKIKI